MTRSEASLRRFLKTSCDEVLLHGEPVLLLLPVGSGKLPECTIFALRGGRLPIRGKPHLTQIDIFPMTANMHAMSFSLHLLGI